MPVSDGYLVGPVLQAGGAARAVVAAIKARNPRAEILPQGAYLRVRVPTECAVSRDEIEAQLGREFRLPGDLEAIMPAFSGRLEITEDGIRWSATSRSETSRSATSRSGR